MCGFHSAVDENYNLIGYDAVLIGNYRRFGRVEHLFAYAMQ